MSSITEQIKEYVDIVDLISQYVQLKKRGSNYFGLCPFHHEKTPSFSVNPKGQFFHCFGCGESGDVITFLMKIENLEFKDAVKELIERYNIPVEFKETQKEDSLIEIHKLAEEYFHRKLYNNPEVLEYLNNRRVSKKTIDEFRIGFAPPSNELIRELKKQFTDEELIRSGLFIQSPKGLYNRFSARIVFPIRNESGKTIAFGGRIIKPDTNRAKYINSPETPLFSKQKILYGLFEAKESAKRSGSIIITEGYMDCIRLHSEGIKNAVATLGTALSEFHMVRLKRYAGKLYFNYDADEAGFRAMARSARIILSGEIPSFVITLPAGEDPDSYIVKYGKENYEKLMEKAEDYFDYIIGYIKSRYDTGKPQEKLKAIEEIKPILLNIKNPTMRHIYISKAAREFDISENILIERRAMTEFFKNINKEEALLSLILKDIELLTWVEDLDELEGELSGDYRELYRALKETYLSGREYSFKSFVETLKDEKLKKLSFALFSLEHTDLETRYDRRKAFLSLIYRIERDKIKRQLKEIEKQLRANPSDDELFRLYNNLFSKLRELYGKDS